MARKGSGTYPSDWKRIATEVKDAADWTCVRCGHPHEPATGYCLTVHHLDGNKANCRWWNIIPLCQRCHLSIQGRVRVERPWIFEHSAWFKPYVAGLYAERYLGETLSRDEVMSRLDELLELERNLVLRGAA